MKKIVKFPEPREWEEYRNTPNATYKSIPELRDSLYKEQGYICAYCMRRIPCKDPNSTENHKIEHIQCRDNYAIRSLDYSNMIMCCPGNIGGSGLHCDSSKGNQDISFTPFDDHFIDTLSYNSKDGHIKSSNKKYDQEINEILNLNNYLLRINRKNTLDGVLRVLMKYNYSKSYMTRILKKWESKDEEGKFPEYCGIVVYYLKKKLSQY